VSLKATTEELMAGLERKVIMEKNKSDADVNKERADLNRYTALFLKNEKLLAEYEKRFNRQNKE
jgi:hypothetical protein